MPESSTMFGTLAGEFTDSARRVLDCARTEAQRLGYQFVSTEHLLLGLLAEGTSEAAKVLVDQGLHLDATRRLVERLIGRGSGLVPKEMPFTPRARYAWEIAFDQSEQLRHSHMDTCHIFFGLVRECLFAGKRGGGAASVFRHLNIDLRELEKRAGILVAAFGAAATPTLIRVAADDEDEWNEPIVIAAQNNPPVLVHPLSAPAPVQEIYPAQIAAGEVRTRLSAALLDWVEAHRLGHVSTTSPILAGSDVLVADVLYFSRERLYAGNSRVPDVAALVVERPDDTRQLRVLAAKMRLLLELGVQVGWMADPHGRRISVFYPGKHKAAILKADDVLRLPELLAGWEVPVARLWPSH
ncbi:MAG: Uma2 family endonuclease [Aphanocapsa lilacina HA4352-LM1]|nr:Uma2 family endonuclease [Aphanocapsa lilacina HA4352-LM1]